MMPRLKTVSRTAATVPVAFIRSVLISYDRLGRDPQALLRRTRITPQSLATEAGRITRHQFQDFFIGAVHDLEDEALGWFTRPIRIGTTGMVWRASLAAPSLEIALRRWFRHQGLVTDDIALTLAVDDTQATITMAERCDLGPHRDFACITALKIIHGFASWLIDSRLPLLGVTLPYAKPPHGDLYSLYFPGQVRFEAAATSLSFDRRYLGLSVLRDDAALRRLLRHQFEVMIVQYRRDRLLSVQVDGRLRGDLGLGARVEDVARSLRLSIRSLHRHLRDEGTSFQAIKDRLRCARATALLTGGGLPVKTIARQLDFADDKAFARAFRGWTGQSPSACRAAARLDARRDGMRSPLM